LIPSGAENSCLGHVLRHDDLLKNTLEGKMIEKAARGSKRLNTLSGSAEKKKSTQNSKEDPKQKKVTGIESAGSHIPAS